MNGTGHAQWVNPVSRPTGRSATLAAVHLEPTARRATILLIAATLVLTACSDGRGAASAASAPTADTTTGSSAAAATTAADGPSLPAQIVCQYEAQEDIERVLGVAAAQVGPSTYANHVSSCRYRYPDGSFDLTVRDLPDPQATDALYAELATQRGHVRDLRLPGATAFVATDGSVIMRKDTQVLTVDVTGLPARFGRPSVSRSDAALLITNAVLGCWS